MTAPIHRRFARHVVAAASFLVPRWRRADWRREWSAEMAHDERHPGRESTVQRFAGSIADAAALRGQAMLLDMWRGDCRFAWRTALRRPAFTALVVCTLALGLGVASAVFALVDPVLLRPLPYRDPSRLVFVWQTLPAHNVFEVEAAPADYTAWRRARSFEDLALVQGESVTLTAGPREAGAEPERVRGARVSASLFPLLGFAPRAGRGFTPEEDADAAAPVVVLGDGLWRRRFGARADALGARVDIDGLPHTIVGIMPRGAHLPPPLAGDDELWMPMRMTPAEGENAISHNYTVIGRLAPGADVKTAAAEMSAVAAAQAAEQPDTHRGIGARVVLVSEQASAQLEPALLALLGAVALLVLIAAANAATLLLARTLERHHELALRSAVGASRSRLVSLAMAEALIHAVLGALAAVVVGSWVLRLLLPFLGDALPAGIEPGIDARVSLATLAVACLVGVCIGALNAWHGPRLCLADDLRGGSRSTAGARAGRARLLLVTSQIALAVVLLAGAGLLGRSFAKLRAVDPGFDPRGVLTFRLALPDVRYGAASGRAAFARSLVERLEAAPEVESAAVISRLPFGGSRGANGFEIAGRPAAPGDLRIADQREVTPAYFRALSIRTIGGRTFTAGDDGRAEPVVVVNRAMADAFWGGGNPIDARVRVTAGEEASAWLRIVGVVENVHHVSLARAPVPEMYRPYAQAPTDTFAIVVRAKGDPAAAVSPSRAAVRSLDALLPVYDVRTMEERIAGSVAQTRATAALLVATALLAAGLAAVAIYGAIWFAVAQRTPEIGVRLALGASRASVFRLVAGRALLLAASGAALGLGAAALAAPLLGGLLYDTRPGDPAAYVMAAAGLLVLTLVASLVPARRAMRVDPIVVLRA
jgi:putative ABC transport system permease protein